MNSWICAKCGIANAARFCSNCGQERNLKTQSAPDLPPKVIEMPPIPPTNQPNFARHHPQAQFSPHQLAQVSTQQSFQSPQNVQTQMPPVSPQKSSGIHNLLLSSLVVIIFAVVIGTFLWVAVFGSSGLHKALPILLALVGLLMTVINTILFVRKIWRITKSTKTTGVVMNVEVNLGMQQSHSSTRNTLFTPTVRFQTAGGRIINYTPNMSTSWSNYRVGENVPVYYDPQQPEKVMVGRFYDLWFPHFLCALVGGMFLFIGATFTWTFFSFIR